MTHEIAFAASYRTASIPDGPYNPLGLILRDGLSFAEWAEIGSTLATMERGLPWWAGDWLNYGEHTYGEKYAQAVYETGREKQTLQNYAWVAGRFSIDRRRENLTWSHHEAVAGLEIAEQERLLDLAEQEQWGVRALREAVQAARKAVPAPKPTESPDVGSPTPNGNGSHGPVAAKEEEPETENDGPALDLVAELEAVDAELRKAQATIQSLQKDDLATEVVSWAEKYARLEGRLAAETNALNEARRLAQRRGKLLGEIRSALGVESDGEILPALRDLLR